MTMIRTNRQKMAEAAWRRIAARRPGSEFVAFARSFPSLIHACGLAQAVAFAVAKQRGEYLEDLAHVLQAVGHSEAASPTELERVTREHPVPAYVRLSRNALEAAGWLKRYVEAIDRE